MLKPVCIPCQRFFKPYKCGIYVLETMPKANNAPRGNDAPEMWEPYKVWHADIYKCEGCKAEICYGSGREPVSIRHKTGFSMEAQRCTVQVNDC